jgi:hypothetical protein
MGRLWKFLKKERNRQVLGWLGGGLVVVATGAWAAFVYFVPAPKPSVEASCGGIAIGGNVSGTVITAEGPTNGECATKPK